MSEKNTGEQPQPKPQFQMPSGGVVRGVEMQSIKTFSPDLEAALRKARDQSDGRYMIAVFTANEGGETVTMHLTRGSKWSNDWFLRSHQLFVSNHLQITPEAMAAVKHSESGGSNVDL